MSFVQCLTHRVIAHTKAGTVFPFAHIRCHLCSLTYPCQCHTYSVSMFKKGVTMLTNRQSFRGVEQTLLLTTPCRTPKLRNTILRTERAQMFFPPDTPLFQTPSALTFTPYPQPPVQYLFFLFFFFFLSFFEREEREREREREREVMGGIRAKGHRNRMTSVSYRRIWA